MWEESLGEELSGNGDDDDNDDNAVTSVYFIIINVGGADVG